MPLSFPKAENQAEIVGRTPGLRGSPWTRRSPMNSTPSKLSKPTTASAADLGEVTLRRSACATFYCGRFCSAESVALPGYIPRPAVITLRA
jgi:hypothetical protein